MSEFTDGKMDDHYRIFSGDLISEKEGYEAMLYMLYAFWKETGSDDLTDILSGGEYWLGEDRPADITFWDRWLEAVQKVKRQGPPPLKFSGKPW